MYHVLKIFEPIYSLEHQLTPGYRVVPCYKPRMPRTLPITHFRHGQLYRYILFVFMNLE
jgi:hypothetical protein